MNQAFGSAEYADVVERVLYNGALAGLSLAGTEYSYQNPLVNRGELHRWSWHGSCRSNLPVGGFV
ncbi:MAG TPA: beta-L-arabinofuranosidase domain-containing protein [Roseiflexaceae bacterium]|nr:beta-L-arabinofuranosidase domain-containing protein [Roseiflexaceae bacterium]